MNRCFLLRDSGANFRDPERVLLFGAEAGLRKIPMCDTICVDGIFSVTPSPYAQIFSFHVIYMDESFPVLFALLPGKEEPVYIKLFRMVLEVLTELGLTLHEDVVFIGDFEKAIINGLRQIFGPDINYRGCLFHLAQAIWAKVQSLKLQNEYHHNKIFRKKVKMLIALAFVPPAQRRMYFGSYKAAYGSDPLLTGIIEYYEKNWLTDEALRITNYERTSRRTNNALEAWHAGLHQYVKNPYQRAHLFYVIRRIYNKWLCSKADLGDRDVGYPKKRGHSTEQEATEAKLQNTMAQFGKWPHVFWLEKAANFAPDSSKMGPVDVSAVHTDRLLPEPAASSAASSSKPPPKLVDNFLSYHF